MNYYYEDYYATKINKLKPYYRNWFYEQIEEEDYFRGMDFEEALSEALSMQQMDEYEAEQEWVEKMMYEDEKKHQPTREEKYPGVVFTPRVKINTICANDDIPF